MSTSSRRPLAAVVLALLVGTATLLLPGRAGAATTAVLSPGPDSVVSGPVEITVQITPEPGEVVQSAEARLSAEAAPGGAQRTIPLQRAASEPQPAEPAPSDPAPGDPGAGDPETWSATLDPSDGIALRNGTYQLEVRATPLVGEPGSYTGHAVRLAVPPPERQLRASPGEDDPTVVALDWDAVALPDFLAYRIQRRPDDATASDWRTVLQEEDPRQLTAVDEVPRTGAFRYRLVVVRSDGAGGELFATSDPRGVRADPDDPGTFDPPRDPDPQPAPPSAEGPGGPVGPVQRPPSSGSTPTPAPTGSAEGTGSGGSAGHSGPVRAPTIRVPAPPAPPAPRPVVPLDDGVFEELLPFAQTETEVEFDETETALLGGSRREGGVLNVFSEDQVGRGPWVAWASGVLLVVTAGHLRRFLSEGARR